MAKKKSTVGMELTITPQLPADLPELPDVPDTWVSKQPKKASQAMRLANKMNKTRHGLFASIPLVCKGEDCPYASTCLAVMYDTAPVGDRCPMEIVSISQKFAQYCQELGVDETKAVDAGLVKELIDCEIIIDRCNQLIADEGDMIKNVVVGISEDGTAYTRPEIHQALNIKDRTQRRKNEILQLLNSTPKDKAKSDGSQLMDASRYAADIMKKYMEMQKNNVVDATFTEVKPEFAEAKPEDVNFPEVT